jgi:multiple sugar transport system permease protein
MSRWKLLRGIGSGLRYLVASVLAGIFLVPFYVMVRDSLLTNTQLTEATWLWLPPTPQWSNYTTLFLNPQEASIAGVSISTGLENSAIIAASSTFFATLFASMAGYALARIQVRGKGIAFGMILATMMIPGAATFVPTYIVVDALHGVDTLWGIIVPGLFSAFSTFFFRQFYLRFPREIEDAGRVDGLGYFGIYRHLLLPNSKGILTALALLSLIESWNAFLWPLVIGQSSSTWTVQVVASSFITAESVNFVEVFAAACVAVVPMFIVFVIMQRYIAQAVTLSGVKA